MHCSGKCHPNDHPDDEHVVRTLLLVSQAVIDAIFRNCNPGIMSLERLVSAADRRRWPEESHHRISSSLAQQVRKYVGSIVL